MNKHGTTLPALLAAALLLPAVALALPAGRQPAANGMQSQVSGQDKVWMRTAHQSNLAEIKAGTLAVRMAHTPMVKNIGKTLVSDHEKLDAKLKQAAQKLEVMLPSQPNEQQMVHVRSLRSTSSASAPFDPNYVSLQIAGHKQAIAMTEKEINQGSSPMVKKLAQKALPVLKKHLRMLRQAEQKMHITQQ